MHHAVYFYVFALAYILGVGSALGVENTVAATPIWVLLIIPILPVIVGYLLTRRKLIKQDAKVQEIHVLVNSRLSKTLDALSAALVENIDLKNRLGLPVTQAEHDMASHPEAAAAAAEEEEI